MTVKPVEVVKATPAVVAAPRFAASVERWRPLVASHFPASQVDNALAVMAWESSGNPKAIGDTTLTYVQDGITYGYSVGLMQVRYLPGRPDKEHLLDPENNLRWSAGLHKAQSWCPWTGGRKLGLCK